MGGGRAGAGGHHRQAMSNFTAPGLRRRAAGAVLLLAAATAVAQPWPRYPPNPTAPPVFEADNPEGLIMAGVRTEVRHAWKRPVHWRSSTQLFPAIDARVTRPGAAEQQAIARTLDALVAVLRATPTGSKGEGFWVNDSRSVGFVDVIRLPPGAPLARWPLEYESRLFPFYHEDLLQGGTWRTSIRGETESIGFAFNRHPRAMRQPVIAKEPAPAPDREPVELHLRPRITDTFAGMPVYERDLVVVARPGRDPWAPVALGRALRALMPALQQDRDNAEQRLAQLREKNAQLQAPAWEEAERERFEKTNGSLRESRPTNYAARLASLEHYLRVTRADAAAKADPQRDAAGAWYWNPVDAHEAARRQLAALGPAQAAQPACWVAVAEAPGADGRYAARGDLVPVGSTPGCREVVEANPAYFDTTLPRTAPQLLTFDLGRCLTRIDGGRLVIPPVTRFDTPPQGCHRHRTMWNEADWPAIVALVVR